MEVLIITGYVISVLVGIVVMLYLSYLVIVYTPRLLLHISFVVRFVRRVKKSSYQKSDTTKNKHYSINNSNNVPDRGSEGLNIFDCFNYWFNTPRICNKANSQKNSGSDKSTLDSAPDIVRQDSFSLTHKGIIKRQTTKCKQNHFCPFLDIGGIAA